MNWLVKIARFIAGLDNLQSTVYLLSKKSQIQSDKSYDNLNVQNLKDLIDKIMF